MRGVGIYAEHLLPALAVSDSSNEYWILTTRLGEEIDWLQDMPDNFHRARVPTLSIGRAGPLISHQFALPRLVRQLRLDVLHCIGVPFNASAPGIPWRQTTRTIVTVHDLTPLVLGRRLMVHRRHQIFYRFQLQACRRAAHLIADSHSTASDIVRYNLAPPGRVTVVPLAAPRFKSLAPPSGLAEVVAAPFILHVGGAEYQKNQAAVLQAFGMLCRDSQFKHRLILVGTHHLEEEIATRLEPRAAGRIMRFSNLSRSELAYLYQKCDVFVFPSLYEGFGLPLLEAMSCGAPVVSARTSSIPEVAGEAAILVEPTDHNALAGAIKQMITDPSLRRRYVQAGYQQIEQFSWLRTAQQTRAVYEQVVRSPITP